VFDVLYQASGKKTLGDFGAGISLDEIIGLSAWQIDRMVLPSNKVFQYPVRAAQILAEQGLESYVLAELWEDGHSVWHHPKTGEPVIAEPTGQVIRRRSR